MRYRGRRASISGTETEADRRRLADSRRPATVNDPEAAVLAENIRQLIRRKGVTIEAVAKAIHLKDRGWLQRVSTKGLFRYSKKSKERLQDLAQYFEIPTEDLWRKDLVVTALNLSAADPNADQLTQLRWRQHQLWPYAYRLSVLLATGEHDFLKQLIDKLYHSLPKDELPKHIAGMQAWTMPDGDPLKQ